MEAQMGNHPGPILSQAWVKTGSLGLQWAEDALWLALPSPITRNFQGS